MSKSILNLLGEAHVISNASWLTQGLASAPISSAAQGSKMLCKRHNKMLSPIDKSAKSFFEEALWAFSEGSVVVPDRRIVVDGDALERWVLKACCGLFSSGELLVKGKRTKFAIAREWLQILFVDRAWPDGTGLHIRLAEATPHRGFAMGPVFANDGTTLAGGGIEFCGIELFVLADPTIDGRLLETGTGEMSNTTYRPGELEILAKSHQTIIKLEWASWNPSKRVQYRNQSL